MNRLARAMGRIVGDYVSEKVYHKYLVGCPEHNALNERVLKHMEGLRKALPEDVGGMVNDLDEAYEELSAYQRRMCYVAGVLDGAKEAEMADEEKPRAQGKKKPN